MFARLRLHAIAALFALGGLTAHANAAPATPSKPVELKRKYTPPPKPSPTAIVYVSPWCGHSGKTFRNACQRVEDELTDAGVPFVTRDIFDERWRDEYVRKMESIGRRPPAVPLIDVEGHLVLGANNGVGRVAADLRRGVEPQIDDEPGYTKPQAPKKRVYEAGERWVEPPDGPAIVYGTEWCPHCRPAKKFLEKRKIKSVDKSLSRAKDKAEHEAHMNRFGRSGPSVPSIYLYGRFLIGFDDHAIEALVAWRRGDSKKAAK